MIGAFILTFVLGWWVIAGAFAWALVRRASWHTQNAIVAAILWPLLWPLFVHEIRHGRDD